MQNLPRQIPHPQKTSQDTWRLLYARKLLHRELIQSFHVNNQRYGDWTAHFQSMPILNNKYQEETHKNMTCLCIETIISFPRVICIAVESRFLVEHNDGAIVHHPTFSPLSFKAKMLIHPPLLHLLLC